MLFLFFYQAFKGTYIFSPAHKGICKWQLLFSSIWTWSGQLYTQKLIIFIGQKDDWDRIYTKLNEFVKFCDHPFQTESEINELLKIISIISLEVFAVYQTICLRIQWLIVVYAATFEQSYFAKMFSSLFIYRQSVSSCINTSVLYRCRYKNCEAKSPFWQIRFMPRDRDPLPANEHSISFGFCCFWQGKKRTEQKNKRKEKKRREEERRMQKEFRGLT